MRAISYKKIELDDILEDEVKLEKFHYAFWTWVEKRSKKPYCLGPLKSFSLMKADWPGWKVFDRIPRQHCFCCEVVKNNCSRCKISPECLEYYQDWCRHGTPSAAQMIKTALRSSHKSVIRPEKIKARGVNGPVRYIPVRKYLEELEALVLTKEEEKDV